MVSKSEVLMTINTMIGLSAKLHSLTSKHKNLHEILHSYSNNTSVHAFEELH
jgi:hypothetical protein